MLYFALGNEDTVLYLNERDTLTASKVWYYKGRAEMFIANETTDFNKCHSG